MLIVVGVLVLLLLFGGLGGAAWYVIKKTDAEVADTSTRKDIETAQEFLPFIDIKDSMIHMGNNQYRAILEVSSINYDLKTDKEQRVIEMSYSQFLNSLMFPITMFISTREIDNTSYLKRLKDDYEAMLEVYPEMYEYANSNIQDMTTLNQQLGTTRQKKKYIIIPYDEANELSMQSDDEKYEYSGRELATRAKMIQEGLMNINIQTNVLTTQEILELMVTTYHRNGTSHAEEIWSKEYLSMIVEGEKNYFGNDLSDADQLEIFLKEFKNKLESSFLKGWDVDPDARKKAEGLLASLKGEYALLGPDEFSMDESPEEIEAERLKREPERTKGPSRPKKKERFLADDQDDDEDVDDFFQPTPTKNMKWQGVISDGDD